VSAQRAGLGEAAARYGCASSWHNTAARMASKDFRPRSGGVRCIHQVDRYLQGGYMAEPTRTLSAWIGRKVHLEYEAGDRTAEASGTLEEENDRGVFISEGERSYFYTTAALPEQVWFIKPGFTRGASAFC
jgi:hypothetical protein